MFGKLAEDLWAHC